MAKVKDVLETLEELIEQGYSAEYIAGYTGYPVAWVMGFIEGKREIEALYDKGP
jgi:hypothetical protein